MTPGQLDALVDVHEYVHGGDKGGKHKPSSDPARDLAALAAL